MTNNLSLDSIRLGGITYPGPLTLEVKRYADPEALAVQLITHEEGYPETLATVSVNLPDSQPSAWAIFVKDYSENAGVMAAFVDKGWLRPTGRKVMTGWVTVEEAELTGELLELAREEAGRWV